MSSRENFSGWTSWRTLAAGSKRILHTNYTGISCMMAAIQWISAIILSRFAQPAKGNGPAGTDICNNRMLYAWAGCLACSGGTSQLIPLISPIARMAAIWDGDPGNTYWAPPRDKWAN